MKTITIDGIEYNLVPKETTSVPSDVYVTLAFQVGDRFEFNLSSIPSDDYVADEILCYIKDNKEKAEWDNSGFIHDLYDGNFSEIPEVQGQDLEDLKSILEMAKPYWEGKPLIDAK